MEHQPAIIFGAGSVGRGFLGQLFSESGYQVVFVDVDQPLIEALDRRGSYTLRLAGVQHTQELAIGPVSALNASDGERVAEAVANASIMATAVGARALSAIARPIAAGLARRWQAAGSVRKSAAVNIIICENLYDAPEVLSRHVQEALPHELKPQVRASVGFVAAVIARMSPVPTPEQRAADATLIVAEPYKVLPVDREAFVGTIPKIVGMYPVARFTAYVERKLYIHNAGHCMVGYLGYRRGYQYGDQAVRDPLVDALVTQALDESSQALAAEHGLDPVALAENIQDLLNRFGNRALGDPISRLARDPLRKLAANDRLVGAARLAQKHGILPQGLSWGIAAALAYDDPADPHAAQLQAMLAGQGIDRVLQDVCGIQPDEPLAEMVREKHRLLHSDPQWRK